MADDRRFRLMIGEARIVRRPATLETLLGSCVAAVFWNRRLGLGAMCHGAMPRCPDAARKGSDLPLALRYVDYAVEYLMDRMLARGSTLQELEVKLFGGADVLPVTQHQERPTVGRLNCEAALDTLMAHGLHPAAMDLGGTQGRIVVLITATGEVLVRRMRSAQAVTEEEMAARWCRGEDRWKKGSHAEQES